MPEPIDCATFQFYTPACHPLPVYHAPLTTDPTVAVLTGFALGMAAVAVILVLILFNNRNK